MTEAERRTTGSTIRAFYDGEGTDRLGDPTSGIVIPTVIDGKRVVVDVPDDVYGRLFPYGLKVTNDDATHTLEELAVAIGPVTLTDDSGEEPEPAPEEGLPGMPVVREPTPADEPSAAPATAPATAPADN